MTELKITVFVGGVCVFMCLYIHVCVQVLMSLCVHIHGSWRQIPGIHLSFTTLVFKADFLLNSELTNSLDLLVVLGTCLSLSPMLVLDMLAFFMVLGIQTQVLMHHSHFTHCAIPQPHSQYTIHFQISLSIKFVLFI